MSTLYELGEQALDELIEWAEQHAAGRDRNESTTRFHLIDQILTRCLAWPIEEIENEDSRDSTFADYLLGKPVARMIVEAKREGVYFDLPAGTKSGVQKLSSVTSGVAGKDLRIAASQVAQYCASRGVSVAAVSNGHQLVAFLGSRTDGVAPLDGSAIIFDGLQDLKDQFRLFWDNLSKPAVEARRIYSTLRADSLTPKAPPPLSSRISGYPGYRRRNDLQVQLEIMAEVFLDDLNQHEEIQEDFLNECYASSGALSQYAMLSKQILESRYSLLHETSADHEVEPARVKKGVSQSLSAHVLASSLSKRPIILLGDVGVGKTMFVRHLMRVEAATLFADALTLYIDFGNKPALLSELNEFVIEEAYAQLFDKYDIDVLDRSFVQAVYNGALNRFDRGIHGDLRELDEQAYRRERIGFLSQLIDNRASHLLASLEHLAGSRHQQVVIFLDNIDQRPLEFQEQVFLISESLASEWPATVFISLRPDTFYKSRSQGTLTAYQPRVFTISPPRVDTVVKKRLAFALKQLNSRFKLEAISPGINVEFESLRAYLEVLADNFENNEDLITLVDNLAGGNIRRALDFVSGFVGSGHVDTRKILDIFEATHSYRIPLHEFIRAIIYGDYEHYDPEASPVLNLFDISQPDGREHFLLAFIISVVESSGDQVGTEGFIPIDDVYDHCQRAGFDAQQIAWAVERGVAKGALEHSPMLRNRSREHLRVTSAGVYTARILVATFAYLDAVVVDTPVTEEVYSQRILNARSISDRVRRAEVFRAYLDRQWRLFEASSPQSVFGWRSISDKLRAESIRISARLAAQERT